ncbi:acyl-CoA carboxylase subunit epsilon [Jidongwangia harbinensis]|uniref:acyl-CoA carboxylase subunit epsilon n=1 Tax=Jidongwangia harbinensis TaxID=2878561 RepID=UPI001CDA4E00|nr:acyl-CoA carboxylase subunit epsilon [Jidongwangia harbinensis]MCA2219321.1 acyl-CoA carboxylase subunit epsilon [Jidongwangia harbinensis]
MDEEPLVRVLRGAPTAEEVAALLGALASRSINTTEPAPENSRTAWTRSALPTHGATSWRDSGLPR